RSWRTASPGTQPVRHACICRPAPKLGTRPAATPTRRCSASFPLNGCRLSDLVPAMDRHDARGKIAHLHVAETGGFHHGLQCLLVRMLANRFGEVAVAAFVVRDQLADARQHLERMEVVQRSKPRLI